jgi:HAD superfamily hydrolase (TIGR01549 family)
MVKAVLLDWDGTLWDVLTFMVETYTAVFQEIGVKPWTREQFRHNFRSDWRSMLSEMGLSDHRELLVSAWDERLVNGRPPAYGWVNDFAASLAQDYSMGVVSSAPRKPLLKELKRNGIHRLMDVIISEDDVEDTKPSAQPLIMACGMMGIKPGEAVYVGDMVEDIMACRKAKMPIVCVAWGIHHPLLLRGHNPDFLADTPDEVLDFIKGLP